MGLDIGMSNGGIHALLACEFNKYCRMTINQNEPDMALIGDINHYSAEEILEYAKIPHGRKVDVIFGGPPCQGFSNIGHGDINDKRNQLFEKFFILIKQLRPAFFVAENAPFPFERWTLCGFYDNFISVSLCLLAWGFMRFL